MSEVASELFVESEIEPEPTGLSHYAAGALEASWRMGRNGKLADWVGDTKDSRITLRPRRIVGEIRGKAFDNYVGLTEDERHQLAFAASSAMNNIDDNTLGRDAHAMINYVPLLFTQSGLAIIGSRERYGQSITFESDKLSRAMQRHVLVGGLATVMYYADYPHELYNVE